MERRLLGIPLGADVAVGYTSIMESMPAGKREAMGNRWQAVFGIGEVASILVITVVFGAGVAPTLLWRIALGLGAVPALVLLLLRVGLPATAIWLIQKGRFREAKQVTRSMYGDTLEMLPDVDVDMPTGSFREFFREIWGDPIKRRATLFGWIASWAQAGILDIRFLSAHSVRAARCLGYPRHQLPDACDLLCRDRLRAGWPTDRPPCWAAMAEHLRFGIVLISLLVAGLAISANVLWLVPIAAAAMLWGHYWDAENVMTIPSMVASPRHKGVASGFGYIHVKLPAFLGIFLFPAFFGSIGVASATFVTMIFPLVGLLAAIFVLPEVYGFIEVRRSAPAYQPLEVPSAP